ncbi:hypothetical protein STFR1_10407 [Bacillus vallismortis]
MTANLLLTMIRSFWWGHPNPMKQDADIIMKFQENLKNSPKHGYKARKHRLKTPVFFLFSDNT